VRIVSRRVIVVSFLMLTVAAGSLAQNSNQDPTIADLQRQIQEMRSQMAKMQNRIAELEAPNGTAETNSTTDPIQPQSQTPPAEALRLQLGEVKTSKEATPFNYKGITLTPGGFLESTILVRTRNENADMANSYTTIPLNGWAVFEYSLSNCLRMFSSSMVKAPLFATFWSKDLKRFFLCSKYSGVPMNFCTASTSRS
jgi:hypothetical protein